MVITTAFSAWRLELFFKSQAELRSLATTLLEGSGPCRLNITNKSRDDRLLESVACLHGALPASCDVCVHYSIKENYCGGVAGGLAAFRAFCSSLAGVEHREGDEKSVLLVSGGGPKRKLDTVKMLELAAAQGTASWPALHVAFNPYFPTEAERLQPLMRQTEVLGWQERERLEAKLATGLVAGIYLQTGSALDLLEEGLRFLDGLRTQQGKGEKALSVTGSVFLPTKRLLAQMRFRPWRGVFLSEKYLSSVPAAEVITRQILDLYRAWDVVPLLESPVKTEADLQAARRLLAV